MTRDELILSHTYIIKSVCKRYRQRLYDGRVTPADLYAYGMIGLCKAADCWDRSRGNFGAYAYLRVQPTSWCA